MTQKNIELEVETCFNRVFNGCQGCQTSLDKTCSNYIPTTIEIYDKLNSYIDNQYKESFYPKEDKIIPFPKQRTIVAYGEDGKEREISHS